MIVLEPTWIQLGVSALGTILTVFFFYKMMSKTQAIEAKFTPIVTKVMSAMGSSSATSKKAKVIEREMIDDFLKTSFPELGIGLDVLFDMGILTDERYDQLKENPEVLITIVNRWLPIVKNLAPQLLKGKSIQQAVKYDH